jgi:D-aminopeptidase
MLTNSLSVDTVYEGVVRYMVERIFAARGAVPWFNPVVGETSDAYLNDMGGLHVRPEHAMDAIHNARGGPVLEGSVGGGTGMSAFNFKGGIGTSSRSVKIDGDSGVVASLVQSNFGGRLTIAGVPFDDLPAPARRDALGASIMMIVATDLPLDNRLLNRVAKRATLGMARAGATGGHGSGDYVIAFSTTYRVAGTKAGARRALAENESLIDVVFQAAADATEEAILNSMFRAQTVVGRDGNMRAALPLDVVMERLRKAGRV